MQLSRCSQSVIMYFALLAISGRAIAQQIPQCAQSCIAQGLTAIGCSDYACACAPDNLAALQSSIAPCLLQSCSAADLQSTLQATNAICAVVSSSEVLTSAETTTVSIASVSSLASVDPVASESAASATAASAESESFKSTSVSSAASLASVASATHQPTTMQATITSSGLNTTPEPTAQFTKPAQSITSYKSSESAQVVSSSQTTTPSSTAIPVSHSSHLKPGAIAGIVIGALLFLAIIILGIFLFLHRRKRSSYGGVPRGAELEARQIEELEARNAPISYQVDEAEKPELPAPPYKDAGNRKPVVPGIREVSPVAELEGMTATMSSPTELSAYEPSRSEVDSGAPVIPPQEMYTRSPQPAVSLPQEIYTQSPRPAVISAVGTESPEELERLAEEERRLDAEIAEAERLRDLRNQRASVQERIARVKGSLS